MVATGTTHTCALLKDRGTIQCWGDNYFYQIGSNSTTANQLLPIDTLPLGLPAIQIAAGTEHYCALLSNDTVKCWGYNNYGQIGNGQYGNGQNTGTSVSYPTATLPLLAAAVQIAAGDSHTCALLSNGLVQCWGRNNQYQLGDGTAFTRLNPTSTVNLGELAIQVSCGNMYTCALLINGTVKCWGDNNYGQIGIGTKSNRVSSPTATVDLGGSAVHVACGYRHVCVLLNTSKVVCWGDNSWAAIGNGQRSTEPVLTPTEPLNLGSVVQIDAGSDYNCAILSDDAGVKCWGQNGGGNCGFKGEGIILSPRSLSDFQGISLRSISTGLWHTCVVLTNGTVGCWGGNNYGQMGIGTASTDVSPSILVFPKIRTCDATVMASSTCSFSSSPRMMNITYPTCNQWWKPSISNTIECKSCTDKSVSGQCCPAGYSFNMIFLSVSPVPNSLSISSSIYSYDPIRIVLYNGSRYENVFQVYGKLEYDEMRVIGGGGGGGWKGGGGGGAGAHVVTKPSIILHGKYSVHIGNGGLGSTNSKDRGDSGGDTSLFAFNEGTILLQATGGGGGGNFNQNGADGGSGGGRGAYLNPPSSNTLVYYAGGLKMASTYLANNGGGVFVVNGATVYAGGGGGGASPELTYLAPTPPGAPSEIRRRSNQQRSNQQRNGTIYSMPSKKFTQSIQNIHDNVNVLNNNNRRAGFSGCPLGYYPVVVVNTITCIKCPRNYYCPDGFQDIPCDTGFIAPEGQETACTVGSWCGQPFEISIPCYKGFYCYIGSTPTCYACMPGAYCPNGYGVVSCPAGYTSLEGAASVENCFRDPNANKNDYPTLPPGSQIKGMGGNASNANGAGKGGIGWGYDIIGGVETTWCMGGDGASQAQAIPMPTASSTSTCASYWDNGCNGFSYGSGGGAHGYGDTSKRGGHGANGFFRIDIVPSCEPCIPGTYRKDDSQYTCMPCEPGTYMDTYGATSCKTCEPGKYSDTTGATQCTKCIHGEHFSSPYGSCSSTGGNCYENQQGVCSTQSTQTGDISYCFQCLPNFYLQGKPDSTYNTCSSGSYFDSAHNITVHYTESRCEKCRSSSGICTKIGETLETCNGGNTQDAQCVNCTNKPDYAEYTNYSEGNLNQCPFQCIQTHFRYPETGPQILECLTCKELTIRKCTDGQYSVAPNCGTCLECETYGNPPDTFTWDTVSDHLRDDRCTFKCVDTMLLDQTTNRCYLKPTESNVCNGAKGFYAKEDGAKYTCTACPNEIPNNATYFNPGFTCYWQCDEGFFKLNDTYCQMCTPPQLKCGTSGGFYVNKTMCGGSVDTQCLPCNAFPPSQSHIAFYYPQVLKDDWSYVSMCKWGCAEGYYNVKDSVTCQRCPNQPWDSFFTTKSRDQLPDPYTMQSQCKVQCIEGKYMGERGSSIPDPTRTTCASTTRSCSQFTACSPSADNMLQFVGKNIQEYTTGCNAQNLADCKASYHIVSQLFTGMDLYNSVQYPQDNLVIESDGDMLFVARNSFIELFSPLRESSSAAGFHVAGKFNYGDLKGFDYVDDRFNGKDARFGYINAMKLVKKRYLFVAEQSLDLVGGMIRMVDIGTVGFPTVSITNTSGGKSCASFEQVASQANGMDIIENYIAFSDNGCQRIHLLTMHDTDFTQAINHQILPCMNWQSVNFLAWDSYNKGTGSMKLWAVGKDEKQMRLKLISFSLAAVENCTVEDIIIASAATGNSLYGLAQDDPRRKMSSLVRISSGVVYFTYANTVWEWNHNLQQLTQIASHLKNTGIREDTACLAQVDTISSMTYTGNLMEHAVYMADIAAYAKVIWRLSMPCPNSTSYWVRDGVCIALADVSQSYCNPCTNLQPTCTPQACSNLVPCSSTADTSQQQCTNKPLQSVYTAPYANTTCLYECNSGYYSSSCNPCNTSVCSTPGTYRSACGGITDTLGGICNMTCTNITGKNNFYWTSGSGVTDDCNFTCINGYFKQGRTCSLCSSSVSCGDGYYPVSCNGDMDIHCEICPVFYKFTKTSSVNWKNSSICDFQCGTGFYLYNSTNPSIFECRNCYNPNPNVYTFGGPGSKTNDASSCPLVLLPTSPTPSPTTAPTPAPTASPTPSPTASPTALPTPSPTPSPTLSPTLSPTPSPTAFNTTTNTTSNATNSSTPPPTRNFPNNGSIPITSPPPSPDFSCSSNVHASMMILLLQSVLLLGLLLLLL